MYNIKCQLWISKIIYKTVCYEDQPTFYIVTFVYWNIVYIESCIYKSVLEKINKLQKKPIKIRSTVKHI
jgi:hypothetical protein